MKLAVDMGPEATLLIELRQLSNETSDSNVNVKQYIINVHSHCIGWFPIESMTQAK